MTPTTGPDIERVPFVTPSRLADAERRVFDEACAAIMDGSAFRMSGGWSDTAAQLFAETIGLGEDTAGWAVSMFRSGTDALVRALLACGVQPGDRVAMPDLAFHAVAGSVLMIGAQPVPIDINADDWCIDAGALEATCPAGSVTAVIAVDNYGTPCDLAALARVTRRIDARLIVDACESLGSTRPGGPVVSHADCV
ncbi:MAG: aminotransferase class I/II-fold pyridoxal phosphate-dependent enzyme, partial [Ilumatobacteraceae bacterium]